MSLFSGETKPAAQTQLCACCDAPADAGQIWEFWLCYACSGEWMRDERFNSGVINAHLGISDDPVHFTPANHERYCAESKRRTAAWVAERKIARAA